jgi:hypothetical protein
MIQKRTKERVAGSTPNVRTYIVVGCELGNYGSKDATVEGKKAKIAFKPTWCCLFSSQAEYTIK